MSILDELPQLPEGYKWAIEEFGDTFQFGIQSNGIVRDGVVIGYTGAWYWHMHSFISFELEDDDAEIIREIREVADRRHGELLEELRVATEVRQRKFDEDRIRREKISRVKDFLGRNK